MLRTELPESDPEDVLVGAVPNPLEVRVVPRLESPVPSLETLLMGIDPAPVMALTASEPTTVLKDKEPDAALVWSEVGMELMLN